MTRPRISIRFMMVVTAYVAVATWWLAPLTTTSTIRTANPMDIAIEGPGYFRVIDEATLETKYTRTGRFVIDQNDQLRIHVDDQIFLIDPPITALPMTRQIVVHRDGSVRAQTPTGTRLLGQIQLARFSAPAPFDSPLQVNTAADHLGFEHVCEPLQDAGALVQGSIERARPNASAIITVYAIAILACCATGAAMRVARNEPGLE